MKRLFYAILLISISVISFNCQKEISYSGIGVPPAPGNNNPNPITATLQGNIVDENGQPAMGVAIKVGSKTATTNARGYFRIINAALDEEESMITAEKTGYFKAYRVFSATSGVNQVMIRLIKKTSAGSVNASSGGTVTLANGSKVSLPANGVVKAAGGSYTGNVNVYTSYIDPSSPNIAQTVPGSFLATDKDNNRVVLASYGMMAVELESPSGEKLQIASGQKATLTMAIPTSLQASAPATISLWYVDEQTGLWKEEGTATKTGTTYVGEVKHFSYWNCDVPGPTVNLKAKFLSPEGLPLVYAQVIIRPVSGYYSAHGMTDSLGQVSGPVPANTNLILEVLSVCGSAAYTQNIGPFSSDVNLGTITVNPNPNIITLQGRLVNCSGNPVTNGFAVITHSNMVRYVNVTGSNGEFATIFTVCGGTPTTGEIYGVDAGAQQQGSTVNVNIIAPTTNAGNIAACGTATLQYINYNIDGTNYSVSSLIPADNFMGQVYDSLASHGSVLGGYHGNNLALLLQFEHNQAAGTFPVLHLGLPAGTSTGLIAPFNVTLTNYPANNTQYFEGVFSGQFKDPANMPHTINGSFRVRRQF